MHSALRELLIIHYVEMHSALGELQTIHYIEMQVPLGNYQQYVIAKNSALRELQTVPSGNSKQFIT